MPRNAQGLYTLPAGNPVIPGTTIESEWANTTMDDIAQAITDSLPRDGSAPMTGPLILSNDPVTNPRQAADKAYVDKFMAFSSGLPVGALITYAAAAGPSGYIRCDGQAVSRTTYPDLFAAIGISFGPGDGATTFNVPDMRDWFVRGRPDARAIGSQQLGSIQQHTHNLNDPGHSHTASQPAHGHAINPHSHAVNDPGHSHNIDLGVDGGTTLRARATVGGDYADVGTMGAFTNISIAAAGDPGSSAAQPGVTVDGAYTGMSIGVSGGAETVPQNKAFDYYIKAIHDAAATGLITGLTSSDPSMIEVDFTNPVVPELDIKSNVAFGIPKLDAGVKIPIALMPFTSMNLLGFFDASSGQNPSQAFPATTFVNGNQYIISVGGTILIRDPVTGTEAMTPVTVGSLLTYITGSVTLPDGWYGSPVPSNIPATSVVFFPTGDIAATNVQDALAELDTEKTDPVDVAAIILTLAVTKTADIGAADMPSGTTAERPASPQHGYTRANSTTNQMEWWNGTAWVPMGGGATGGLNNPAFFENDINVTADYTITTGKNAMSAGPINIANGVTVTVPNGSVWSVV